MHNHKVLYYDDSFSVLHNEGVSNFCKRMNSIKLKSDPMPNARIEFGHNGKSLSPILKELMFWQPFWEMDSAECTVGAKAWLSEGVPADIQLQPTQRN